MSKEEIDEQAELEEKAQIIAEATGRTKEAVLEDLLDDGIVNLSNEEKKDASLVEQLKEAAELIATVQNINKQVFLVNRLKSQKFLLICKARNIV